MTEGAWPAKQAQSGQTPSSHNGAGTPFQLVPQRGVGWGVPGLWGVTSRAAQVGVRSEAQDGRVGVRLRDWWWSDLLGAMCSQPITHGQVRIVKPHL